MQRALLLTFLGAATGLAGALAGCKRPADIFELEPLDGAPMASCSAHGPLQRTCDACNGGDLQACRTLAFNYEQRADLTRRDRDLRLAALFHGRTCTGGYAPGCVLINDHYASIRGLDVPTRKVAAERRDHACGQVAAECAKKDALACRVEGMCLAEPWPQRKQPRDLAGAARAFASACELGDARGCVELGWARAEVAGDDAGLGEAFSAYQKACTLESLQGCMAAAAHTYYGIGTTRASEQALATASDWCERGSGEACQALRGYFAGLRPLLAHASVATDWRLPDAMAIDPLELRPAYVAGIGRVGFCVGSSGTPEKIEMLDSTGEPTLDQLLRDAVAAWRFPRRPQVASTEALCAVQDVRVVFTFRSTGSRPFFTLWESYMTPRGGTLLLDLDPLR
jgi:hypothetical protein